ncbi:hypothetical protein WEI85_04170 [Actinomycetes bacterium KLBMP 9797]
MAGFALGVIVGLVAGGYLGQLRSAAKGSRASYTKAKAGVPGLQKAAREAVVRYFGYLLIAAVIVGALLVGLARGGDSSP